MTREKPLLKVENLALARDGRTILSDVNLEVYPGQIHALLGVNGSGKSSLAYALLGCSGHKPDAGRIWLDGEEVTELPESVRAHQRRSRRDHPSAFWLT